MHKLTYASLTFMAVALASPSRASTDGVDYVAESSVIVYGGSHFWARTKNPVDSRTVYAERLGSGSRNTLYQGEGVISEVQASSKGALVAVLERVWEENVSSDRASYTERRVAENGEIREAYYFEEARLHILDLNGKIVDTIKGVRRFAWDPSGSQIAYITGKYSEDGVGFATTGTWIYDLASKQSQQIYSGGIAVEWAQWDGKVYIYDPSPDAPETRVYSFEPSGREITPTPHKGIFFSPNGAYYYTEGEGVELKVYRTDTDEEIQVELPDPSDQRQIASRTTGWFGNATLILPPNAQNQGDFLYDMETRTTRQAQGAVVPMGDSMDQALLLQGVTFAPRSVNEFLAR